jgi:ferric-dicitrate binding protein FerR (iron transport regulator)
VAAPLIGTKRLYPGLFDPHYHPTSGTLPRDERVYGCGARETRSIKLPDSSEAILHGQSRLHVLYAAWVREATVAEGEVLFDVAWKWPRPILVFAGGRHIEAPGGRFDVRVVGPQRVELSVLEGRVTVKGLPYRRPATPQEARDFDPGMFVDETVGPMQVALLDNGSLTQRALTAADLRSRLGWEPQQVLYVSP